MGFSPTSPRLYNHAEKAFGAQTLERLGLPISSLLLSRLPARVRNEAFLSMPCCAEVTVTVSALDGPALT